MIKVTKVGQYILQKQIGKGSMGTIWLSHHMGLDLPVAVKILKASLVEDDPEYVERFIQEGNLAGSVHQKNIVRIFDAGCQNGTYYMVMEYIDGGNALELIEKRGRLNADEVLEFGIVLSDALQEAHDHNIIHRDIKPENIMLTKEGRIKLADLGLAKRLGDDFSSTMIGAAIGTPNYIAPEQTKNAKYVDARSDIYSLGATLYHMITGKVPFPGESCMDVMMMHCQNPLIPPKKLLPEIPGPINSVICKMMEKDPAKRYQNCSELNEALNKIKYGSSASGKNATETQHIKPNINSGKTVTVKLDAALVERTRKTTSAARKKSSAKSRGGRKNKKNNQVALISSVAGGIILLLVIIAAAASGGGDSGASASVPKEKPAEKTDGGKTKTSKPKKPYKPRTAQNSSPTLSLASLFISPKKKMKKAYRIRGESLTVNFESGVGGIATEKSYDDFAVKLEYRWLEKEASIKFNICRISKDEEVSVVLRSESPSSGFLSSSYNFTKYDGGNAKRETKGRMTNLKLTSGYEKPFGDWNTIVIVREGITVKVLMNDKKAYEIEDLNFDATRIGFNVRGKCNVEFRKMELKEL